jgi:hypothetical protein
VVDVQQVAVEVQVLVTAELNGSVGRAVGQGTRRECHLGVECKGGERHPGDALGGELGIVDDDLLDVRMGWTVPGRGEWSCHGEM